MAVNYAKNRQTLRKANDLYHDSNHAAFRETKTKSFYPNGRKKGAGLSRSEQYCANYDAIFGKKKIGKGGSSKSCCDCGLPITSGADVTQHADDSLSIRHGDPSCTDVVGVAPEMAWEFERSQRYKPKTEEPDDFDGRK